MQAKYKGYCWKCGRPVFEKDVFDFDPNNKSSKKAICLVCFTGNTKNNCCHHWAVTKKVFNFSGSNRYRTSSDYWSDSDFTCLICSKKITVLGKTQYINYQNKNQHGRSYPSYNAKSYINHEPTKTMDNPDYHSMITIQEMLKMEKYTRYYGILRVHLECLLQRNPCFQELTIDISSFSLKSDIENNKKYIKTRCKISDYSQIEVYIPYLERLIEIGIKYVKDDYYCDIKDLKSVEVSVLDYAKRVVELEDMNFLNEMYRKVVMPDLDGSSLEGLDLYGLADDCYNGDEIFAAQDFVWRLIVDSIFQEI